jgi:chorismate mutase
VSIDPISENKTSTSKVFREQLTKPITLFGPCSAESELQVLETARLIAKRFPRNVFRAGVWKPRTRPGSFEGAGDPALHWLSAAGKETGMPVITEVATTQHVESCLKAGIDMLWIGARTTVNPFAVQEIAEALKGTNLPVFVKNPINPDLSLWIGAIERLQKSGIEEVLAIHRGFHSFETDVYRYAPRWEIVIDLKTRMPDLKVICDASHISGDPVLIPSVAQKALDLDLDGLMIETHINPSVALSDAKQQITPAVLHTLFEGLVFRKADADDNDFHRKLLELRSRVDSTDDLLLQALITRMNLIRQIGEFKKDKQLTILQIRRWEEILTRQLEHGIGSGLDGVFVKKLYELIHEESIRIQTELFRQI